MVHGNEMPVRMKKHQSRPEEEEESYEPIICIWCWLKEDTSITRSGS